MDNSTPYPDSTLLSGSSWEKVFNPKDMHTDLHNIGTEAYSQEPNYVYITHTPFDITSIAIPFASAFLGATAAFIFSATQDRIRENGKQFNTANEAQYGLLMSTSTLFNLKSFLLFDHREEFERAQNILAKISPTTDKSIIGKALDEVGKILSSVGSKDTSLGGLFLPWQETEFPMMPSPESLQFMTGTMVDLVRLVHLAKIETNQIAKRISERNRARERGQEPSLEESISDNVGRHTLIYYYEMLSYRKVIGEHVDVALVVIDEAMKQITEYQKGAFPKRNWIAKLLFGKRRWQTYTILEKWRPFMPPREAFADTLSTSAEREEREA